MKNKKKVIALIVFAIVLTLTIASTYAYFTASATSRGNAQQVNVKTATLGITYTHGTKVETGSSSDATNIHDNWDTFLGIDVTSTGTIEQYFDIIWDTVTTNTIVGNHNGIDTRSDFTWTLYEIDSTYNGTDVASSNEIIASGTNKETGYLYGTQSGDIILNNESIGALATKHYVLHIHFNYDEERNQDYQQGKEFSGTIKVRIHEEEAPFVGNARDWVVSEEQNETGGYTLEAFVGDLDTMTVADGVTRTENYYTDENISPFYFDIQEITSVSEMAPGTNVAYDLIVPSVVDGKNITELGPDLVSGTSMDESINFKNLRIKSLTISEGIKELKSAEPYEGEWFGSFMYLINNNDLSLPETLETIGEASFMYNNINNLELPSNIVSIGDIAFGSNKELFTLEIPASVVSIDYGAFVYTSLSELTFETENGISSLKTIGEGAFLSTEESENKLTSLILPEGLETIGDKAFDYQAITSITIPSTVETIGDYSFMYNNITSITIPENVIIIGEEAFRDNSLSSIVFAGTSTDGSGNDTSSLTTIGKNAFRGTNSFTSVYIPSSVTRVEWDAFGTSLTTTKIYVNKTVIPNTFYYDTRLSLYWNGQSSRDTYETWILDGSGNYTMYSAYTG